MRNSCEIGAGTTTHCDTVKEAVGLLVPLVSTTGKCLVRLLRSCSADIRHVFVGSVAGIVAVVVKFKDNFFVAGHQTKFYYYFHAYVYV